MNQQEALHICRLAKAASPAQAVDEYTPELWFEVLKPYRFVDAKDALIELAGESEWIHVSHIKARLKRIRRDRLTAFGPLPEPPEGCDGAQEYRDWYVSTTRAIADGHLTERPALTVGAEKPKELDFAKVFRSVGDVTTEEPA